MVSPILGPDGRSINRQVLSTEIAIPTDLGVRSVIREGVASGLSPDALELELAEAALLGNDDDVLLTLCALRDAGVRLALDGFGRETASLSVLRRLPLTTLKIDRALVRELPNGHEDVSLMHAIIGAAHAMGLTVVAEGVETEEQRALLACLGCDAGQGFLHSRPMPPSALAGLLLHAHP